MSGASYKMDLLTPLLSSFGLFASFFYGLCMGSFANVCIYRMPLDLSIVFPPSSCPKCSAKIKWRDNIPLLSYIYLGGKCRNCKNQISYVYPTVELICGLLFALLFYKYGLTIPFFIFALMSFCLIVVSGIDYYHQVIPDIFPLILIIAGLASAVFNDTLGVSYFKRLTDSVFGALAGGGSLFIIGIIGKQIYKKDALGGGDVKLMAGVGALIGWEKVLFAIFMASFFGALAGAV
jgi:leader peptidase (prepilin peptidase)/N-methyltransferase